jgi:hypothetical protein
MRLVGFLLVTLALGAVSPASAEEGNVAVAGSGNFGERRCLELIGYRVSDRERWLGAYFTNSELEAPVGACPETDQHEDLGGTPRCVAVVGTGVAGVSNPITLYLKTRGTDGKDYYVRIVDYGPNATDAAGVTTALPQDPALCGASQIGVAPVYKGGFSIVA